MLTTPILKGFRKNFSIAVVTALKKRLIAGKTVIYAWAMPFLHESSKLLVSRYLD